MRGQGVGLPTVKVPFWPGVRTLLLIIFKDSIKHVEKQVFNSVFGAIAEP